MHELNAEMLEKMEKEAQATLSAIHRIQRFSQPAIRFEVRENGLVVVSGWRPERPEHPDSFYRPMPLEEALGVLSDLARELLSPPCHFYPDKHAH